MATLAAAGEWRQVIELESQRSVLLNDAFSEARPADEVTARQIRAILASDKQLMGMGVTARDEAAAELAQLQRGRKVNNAYRNASL